MRQWHSAEGWAREAKELRSELNKTQHAAETWKREAERLRRELAEVRAKLTKTKARLKQRSEAKL